jgi:hypothetical protein
MPGDDLIGQEHATSVDVEIDVPFVVGQLERMLHRRNARIGDEDLPSPQLSQRLFKPTLDRSAFSHVDFDKNAVADFARCSTACLNVPVGDGYADAAP